MISAHLITHQCIVLDYCLEATIRSMMDLCEDVYVNDGGSTDGTLEVLYALQREYGEDRLKIFVRKWTHNRAVWASEKNFLLEQIPLESYVLCIDADEVFHEGEMQLVRGAVERGYAAVSFNVIHFYGRPTHYIEGPAWYKKHTRLWKRSTGIRLMHRDHGCADDVVWPDGTPAHLARDYNCGASIYHYGNCRAPKALGMKSKKADDLYQYSTAYENGTLAGPRSFTYGFEKVGAKKFNDTHPKYIKDWYDTHKDQQTEYDGGGESNMLWCFGGAEK